MQGCSWRSCHVRLSVSAPAGRAVSESSFRANQHVRRAISGSSRANGRSPKNSVGHLDFFTSYVDNQANYSPLGAEQHGRSSSELLPSRRSQEHGRGYQFPMLPTTPTTPAEPSVKRAVVFIDGQNLFNAAKTAFGYSHPNYDPVLLADRICADKGWVRTQIRFYTGMPSSAEDPSRHRFWTNKLVVLRRQGVCVYTADPVSGQNYPLATECPDLLA